MDAMVCEMSTTFALIKGNEKINIAHRHLGPDGLSVVYNSELLKVNRSLDFLFLALCQYVKRGWRISGDYEHPNGFSPIEFYNEFKKYHRDHRDLVWHEDLVIGTDGTYWLDLTRTV